MAQVFVKIEEVNDIDDDGHDRDGVRATCSRCDHEVESFGQEAKSRRRCLALLREECPNSESNFYVDSEDNNQMPDPVPKRWYEK